MKNFEMVRMTDSERGPTAPGMAAESQAYTEEAEVDCGDTASKYWYAVKCKSRQERIASTNLSRAGIPIFFPQIKESRKIKQSLVLTAEPLFPGYLFAKFDVRREYRLVKYARGVHGIVSFGMSPAVVDEELIQAIRERLDGQPTDQANPFSAGQVVKIQSGPLHGMEAIFERPIPPYQRAVLLLRAISFRAKLIVDLENIVNL
ncbi:MAG TPA: transcription termination/antitermination NusG family protein [Nitrospiraceae bacterium]|nr:transcription termination/antitermination NusG family protein [Nitrospiraceae bacterium]